MDERRTQDQINLIQQNGERGEEGRKGDVVWTEGREAIEREI